MVIKMFWIFSAEGWCVLNLCDGDNLSRLILVEILVLTSEETQQLLMHFAT